MMNKENGMDYRVMMGNGDRGSTIYRLTYLEVRS